MSLRNPNVLRDYKASVRLATTANITLSGHQAIDGSTTEDGYRVLVKDQTLLSENGIYVAASGAWSRSKDADQDAEITPGTLVPVEYGTTNATTLWMATAVNDITLGITDFTFSQIGGGGGGGTPAGSDGYVQFNDGGAFGGSPNFFWDDVNSRLGIGTDTPGTKFHIAQTGAVVSSSLFGTAWASMYSEQASNLVYGAVVASETPSHQPYFAAVRARGTLASPTTVANNDNLFVIASAGFDGTNRHQTADINFEVDGAVSSNVMPARIVFRTSATTNAAITDRMTIDSAGDVTIGNGITNLGHLHVEGSGLQGRFTRTDSQASLQAIGTNATVASGNANFFVSVSDSFAADVGGSIGFLAPINATPDYVPMGYIWGRKENGTSGNQDGFLAFGVRNNTAGAAVEAMRITSTSLVEIYSSAASGASMLSLERTGTAGSSNGAVLRLYQNDGTTMVAGERLGVVTYQGFNSSTNSAGADIGAYAEGTWTGSSSPGYLSFLTTPSGSTVPTEAGRFTSTSKFQVFQNADSTGIQIYRSSASGATSGGALGLIQDDGTAATTNERLGVIAFQGAVDTGGSIGSGARIEGFSESLWAADDTPGYLKFLTTPDGSGTALERMRITSAGAVSIPTDSVNFSIGAGSDLTLQHNGTNSIIATATGALYLNGVAGSEIVINQPAADVDFRVASDTKTHAMYISGADGYVGINNSTPAAPLHVVGAAGSSAVALVDDGYNDGYIYTDATAANVFTVTIAGNGTLANPTGMVAGFTYMWVITQDATGGWNLTYDTLFKFPGGTTPTLSTSPGAIDLLSALYDGTSLLVVSQTGFS